MIAPWLADAAMPTRSSAGFFDVGEVGERALADDDDFGVERQVHHLVVGDDLSSATLRSL